MRRIYLKNIKKYALVSDEDYAWLSKMKWQWGGKPGKVRARIQRKINGKRILTNFFMAREIMGNPEGLQVDHINRNGLDNRRENLRVCTNQLNSMNRGPGHNNKSGYKGVSVMRNRWWATIGVNGKKVYLGTYMDKKDAARMYNKAAKFVYGEFAWLNKV